MMGQQVLGSFWRGFKAFSIRFAGARVKSAEVECGCRANLSAEVEDDEAVDVSGRSSIKTTDPARRGCPPDMGVWVTKIAEVRRPNRTSPW